MTLETEDRLLNGVESHGPNILNSWTHGDLVAVNMLGFVHWEFSSMQQRNERIWQYNFSGMQQADFVISK